MEPTYTQLEAEHVPEAMTTASPEVGTRPTSQFAPTAQSPSPPIQTKVAGCRSGATTGRSTHASSEEKDSGFAIPVLPETAPSQ